MKNMISYIKNLVETGSLPGMLGAEVDGYKVSTFSLGTIDGYEAVNERYMYDIASLTKLFTATRILQLVEAHQCAFTDPIQKYIPQFNSEIITIEHCLLHRSGFAASAAGRYTMDNETLRASILACDDLIAGVDEKMVYSCINFVVLGFVIEAIDGNFEASLIDNIFIPASMRNTMFNPDNPDRCVPTSMHDGVAVRGVVNDTTAQVLGGVSGNAGLFSTLQDLIQFVISLMNERLFSKSMMDLLVSTNIDSRSYGWNRFPHQETSYLYHTGYTGPSILLIPHKQKALILLTNRNYPKLNPEYVEQRLEIFNQYLSQSLED